RRDSGDAFRWMAEAPRRRPRSCHGARPSVARRADESSRPGGNPLARGAIAECSTTSASSVLVWPHLAARWPHAPEAAFQRRRAAGFRTQDYEIFGEASRLQLTARVRLPAKLHFEAV